MNAYWKIQTQDTGLLTLSFKMKANTIRLYKHYCEMAENPVGVDTLQRALVKKNALKAKADLEEHFKNGKKYKNDPEIQELLGIKTEVQEDGKKSKR